MKRILTMVFLAAGLLSVSGQSFYNHPEIFYMPSIGPEKFYEDRLNNNVSDNPGLQYRLQTGMLFSSLSYFNSFTSFVSPGVILPVGKRFAIEVGTTFSTTSFYGEGDADPEAGRINSLLAYARGVFSVNPKLLVYGEVAKSMIINPSTGYNGFESITMGMEYMLSPGFRIGASITSRNGFDPFYMGYPYRYY
jgi:hypothetical protein